MTNVIHEVKESIKRRKYMEEIILESLRDLAGEPDFLTNKEKGRMKEVKEEKVRNEKAILWLSLIKEAGEYMNKNSLRYGQSVFNVSFHSFPDEVASLAGTEVDCFYDDSKTGLFLEKLIDLVQEY